jgi:hypothetical protein
MIGEAAGHHASPKGLLLVMEPQLLKFTVKLVHNKVCEFQAPADLEDPAAMYRLIADALHRDGKKLITDYTAEVRDMNGKVVVPKYVVTDPWTR